MIEITEAQRHVLAMACHDYAVHLHKGAQTAEAYGNTRVAALRDKLADDLQAATEALELWRRR